MPSRGLAEGNRTSGGFPFLHKAFLNCLSAFFFETGGTKKKAWQKNAAKGFMFIFCPRRQKTNQKNAAQGERFRSQKSRRAAFLRPSTFSPLWIPLLLFKVGENNFLNKKQLISPKLSLRERSLTRQSFKLH